MAIPTVLVAQTPVVDRDRDPALDASKRLAADLQKANAHSGEWYLLSRIRLADIGYSQSFYVPTGDTGGGLSVAVEAPQKLYFVPHKKVALSAEFNPGYAWISNGDRRGQFMYNARADAQFLFNHLYLDGYVQRADALRARAGDINRLVTARETETGLNGELKYSSRTSLLFEASLAQLTYPRRNRLQPSNIPVELYDRDTTRERVSLNHKTFPHTSLYFAGEHAKYDFHNAGYKNSERTYGAAGFRFRGTRWGLSAEAGPARLTFDDPAQHDYSGVFGELTASIEGKKKSLAATLQRDSDFTLMANNNYYILTRASATYEYAATNRLTLRATSNGERDDYDVPVSGHIRRDTIQFHALGWRYALHHWRGGFDVGYYQRRSTFAGDEDDGIRLIVDLSFTP
ncbi:MAG TPA: hypothetical protein VFN10_07135 [Thermoanaerobaculia bacterium]|nr:hypothetical protein [Thermoanaerobaculia bacterium]